MMHLTARNDRCGGGGTRRYQPPAPTVVRHTAMYCVPRLPATSGH